jgi:nitrite reductase (cytochrome c-552)
MNKHIVSWSFTAFVLIAATSVIFSGGCTEIPEPVTPNYETNLSADETSNKAFADKFPLHYQSYLNNADDTRMTEYAGSVPHDKHDNINPLPKGYKHAQPYLKNLWLGYPFSYEYQRARGHVYSIEDILKIDRINNYSEEANLPATCWNCKTNKLPKWRDTYGDDFWSMEFHDFRTRVDIEDHAIGCNLCHDPESMDLQITSMAFIEAMSERGVNVKDATRNEMRAYVCGQCHVEYYFQEEAFGPKAKAKFPWAKGFTPEDSYEYFKDKGTTTREGFEGNFIDWTHAVSDTPMLKAQHPEFETWIDGPHGAAGVSCADCHMPYIRVDGKRKISSHHWTSPLKSIDRSCRQCHADRQPEYLEQRVLYTQKRTWEQLLIAQEDSVRAHEAIRLASEYEGDRHPDYNNLMIQARELTRKGQWFWDMVSAENSVGFHNPVKALETLTRSQTYSRQATQLAIQATGHAIGSALEGDIYEIVPPIMEHSRKLQQSQEHLDSHKWLQYLPLLPEADLVWDGQKKVGGD